jgi:mono/diheme cytochrome c family protein
MFKFRYLILILIAVLIAAGCVAPPPVAPPAPAVEQAIVVEPANTGTGDTPAADTSAVQAGAGFGPESGMMERHHAAVPAQYTNLVNTVPADEDSLARGQMVYAAQCETCHGATGMGEGPAGQALDPAPAPLAHTSQMLSDGYLYWRISEGGHSFETAMPAWSESLSEQAHWDLINYMRSLESDMGQGQGMAHGQGMGGMGRGQGMGGQMMQRQGQMLNAAMAAGLISQDDVSFFQQAQQVLLDKYGAGRPGQGRLVEQAVASGQAVADGVISQADADRYTEIHDKMMQVEQMP